MNIVVHIDKNKKYIYVLGEVKSKEAKKKLVESLNDFTHEVILSISNKRVLSKFLLDEIYRLIRLKTKFTLHVDSIQLSQYLHSLGIAHQYMDERGFSSIDRTKIVIRKDSLGYFMKNIFDKYGYDFAEYEPELIKRALRRYIIYNNLKTFKQASEEITSNKECFVNFFNEFSISITSFYRNPEVFRFIRDELIPYLDTFPQIRIWVAGGSTGEEAYSLAIMLDELDMLKKSIIYSTDYNDIVLERAREGVYPRRKLEKAIAKYRISGGTHDLFSYFDTNDSYVRIKDKIRKRVQYFNHNLLTDSAFNEFHLILCQNVFIYFSETQQSEVIDLFSESLNRTGFLVMGASENIRFVDRNKSFEQVFDRYHIYKKVKWRKK